VIDDNEYHWRLIAAAADGVDMPLRHHPYLVRAIESQGINVDLDWGPTMVGRLCANLIAMRAILAGEDD
jgi:hypothetical protein